MELENGEKVILDDAPLGFRRKLVLTNQRLFESKRKGVFSVKWVIEKEIPLSEIVEATQEMETFTSLTSLIVKLKDGKKIIYDIKLSDSQVLSASIGNAGSMIPMKVKATVDKYMNAINHQVNKKSESPLDVLKLRLAKGEITKKEYEELKKTLEV